MELYYDFLEILVKLSMSFFSKLFLYIFAEPYLKSFLELGREWRDWHRHLRCVQRYPATPRRLCAKAGEER